MTPDRPRRLGEPLTPDGMTARRMRVEMGWITKNSGGYVGWDHLLDEAERRYWAAKVEAQS